MVRILCVSTFTLNIFMTSFAMTSFEINISDWSHQQWHSRMRLYILPCRVGESTFTAKKNLFL